LNEVNIRSRRDGNRSRGFEIGAAERGGNSWGVGQNSLAIILVTFRNSGRSLIQNRYTRNDCLALNDWSGCGKGTITGAERKGNTLKKTE
jgi:hypothetical protein